MLHSGITIHSDKSETLFDTRLKKKKKKKVRAHFYKCETMHNPGHYQIHCLTALSWLKKQSF